MFVVHVFCVVSDDTIHPFIHAASHLIIVSLRKLSYLLDYLRSHCLVLFHHSFAVNIKSFVTVI